MIISDILGRMQINAVRPGTELNQSMDLSSVTYTDSIGGIVTPVVSLDRRPLASVISQEDMECYEQVFRAISEARKKFDEVCREHEKMLAVRFTLDGDKFPIVRAKDLVKDYVRVMENVGIMDYDTLKEAIRLREQLDHERVLGLLNHRSAAVSDTFSNVGG